MKTLTESQVRIANSQLNFKAALSIPLKDLYEYVDNLRKEGKDRHGKPNWQKFSHYPLVSFVDRDDMEEIVFKTKEDFPKGTCDLVTKRGELLARLT